MSQIINENAMSFEGIDSPDMPNTARFWRLNSIEGIKMEICCVEYPFPDPEAMEHYRNNLRELKALEEQERKVKARYERIKAMRANSADT